MNSSFWGNKGKTRISHDVEVRKRETMCWTNDLWREKTAISYGICINISHEFRTVSTHQIDLLLFSLLNFLFEKKNICFHFQHLWLNYCSSLLAVIERQIWNSSQVFLILANELFKKFLFSFYVYKYMYIRFSF